MNRQSAQKLLEQYVQSPSLWKHMLAVEGAMRGYARKFGEDEEYWGITGLLHDIDYEKYPDVHPQKAEEILQGEGYPQEMIEAILGHGSVDAPRSSLLARTLFAVDEMASFIIAVALVRPDGLVGLKPKSVKKKLKDKGFARAVDRELLQKGADELGVDFTEHIQTVIDGLSEWEEKLQEENLSLL